jgi:hypothetical protein
MRLTATIQLLVVALTAQSSASPVAAPPSVDVASRDFTELSTDTAAIQKRSFQRSCDNKRLTGQNNGDPVMHADCRAPSGAMVRTSLSLNNCIANRGGVIVWAKGLVLPTHSGLGRLVLLLQLLTARAPSLLVATSGQPAVAFTSRYIPTR